VKQLYVADLKPNQEITAAFLVQYKEVRQKRTGEPYLTLTLTDKTGELDAKMWDNAAPVIDKFERDDIVEVRGMVQIFQNRVQLTVQKMRRLEDHAVDLADYLRASKHSPEAMFAELQAMVSAINDTSLRGLLEAILGDETIARDFRRAPAAKTVHHAFLGGLLEHVLSMARVAKAIAPLYEDVDADLLLAGVVLHDIGKTRELNFRRSISYSTEGNLIGHIQIGLRMIDEKLRLIPDFPERTRLLLEHLILSHHGALEFGSPKLPQFAEAMLLHQIDALDSRMEAMRAAVACDDHAEGEWTGYISSLERSVLKKDRFLAAPVSAPATQSPSQTPLADQLAKAWQTKS